MTLPRLTTAQCSMLERMAQRQGRHLAGSGTHIRRLFCELEALEVVTYDGMTGGHRTYRLTSLGWSCLSGRKPVTRRRARVAKPLDEYTGTPCGGTHGRPGDRPNGRILTSEDRPIRVDFVPLAPDIPGKLGLTFAPGKKASAMHAGGRWERNTRLDLTRIRDEYGCALIVPLIEAFEFRSLGIEDYFDLCTELGLEVLWTPVTDQAAPRSRAPWAHSVQRIVKALKEGKTVVAHCRGGHGRAGTMGATVLVALGVGVDEAIATVRRVRDPNCVATMSQERFVEKFAEEVSDERDVV